VRLNHYTLTSGHNRLTDRGEVADEVVEVLRPIVAGGSGDLPGGLGLRLILTAGESAGGWLYTIYRGDMPLVTCGLAMTPTAASELWPHLLEVGKVVGFLLLPKPPPVPWLSVATLPGLAFVGKEVRDFVGDLERCIAWALLDTGIPADNIV
jgi:hypothetical protein